MTFLDAIGSGRPMRRKTPSGDGEWLVLGYDGSNDVIGTPRWRDDTILRLGLCDRVDLLAVRKFLDGIEAQRAEMSRRGLADQLEPEPTAMCACGHPYSPGHQTPGTECARDTCQCDRFEPAGPTLQRYLDAEADAAGRRFAAADFSSEHHLTPAGGPAPYESIEIVREGGDRP